VNLIRNLNSSTLMS